MIKVMIADDQALIRESLQIILSAHQDIQVTSAVADGHEVIERIPQDRPDVVLMDIRMPKMDGVMATKEVKERFPEVKIIILTTFDDDDFIFRALKYWSFRVFAQRGFHRGTLPRPFKLSIMGEP